MRIRSIKPEFFIHEALFECEKEAKMPLRIAFAGLWCAADRRGRFRWEPRRLGVQILPYDGIDFSRVLDALSTRGFIQKYRVGDACFGWIPSFERHQIVNNRERESELPEFTQSVDVQDIDAWGTRGARVGHACKAEGKGREGNKEGNIPDADASFEEFWKAYPKKAGKADARKAWSKMRIDDKLPEILVAVRLAKASVDWTKDGGKYIPHPVRWLNREGWMDDPSTWTKCNGAESFAEQRRHKEFPLTELPIIHRITGDEPEEPNCPI